MTDKKMTLEPCPFCGGRAKTKTPYVRCVDCGAQMNPPDNELPTAISAWNHRHLSQPAERGEAVEKAEMVRIVCDWANADPFPRFIEAETPDGKSISLPWHSRSDGLKEFHLYTAQPPAGGVPDKWQRTETESEQMTEYEKGVADGWDECRSAMISATPSPTIDVADVRTLLECIEGEHGDDHTEADCKYCAAWNKLASSIGDAK